ncbi:alpha/beta hydrolase [uncultured Sphingomonas sp.]|uniref:alpha/beta hydrolase n=1 Tax=uncultured Sphingomonas sp. TaxID=158754 RepID=UPI0035CAD104
MPTRHLVDPELAPLLDLVPDMGVSAEKLEATRARVAAMTEQGLAEPDERVRVTEHFAPGRDGAPDVRLRLYRPDDLATNAPIVMHVHGGGFLFGTAELGDPRNRDWARTLGCAIASIDYRIAPETPYPGALEDCYAVLEWLHANAAGLGLDTRRIAIRGESAGGGLAAGLALLARDRGGPEILFQLLIYPMIDDRTCTSDEPNPFAGQFIWDRASNAFGWKSWLGREPGAPDIPYHAAPARASDLSGLPPTFIGTAALDVFIDENLDYARRLIRAGVPTEVYVAPGAFHGFDAMAPAATVSRIFTERCQDALRRAFAG